MASTHKSSASNKPSGRRKWIVLGALALVAIIVAGFGAYAYSKLSSARDDLNLATTNATELQDALTAGDQATARAELDQLQANVNSAESNLGSSVLSLAAKAPVLGKNIKAVRTISSAIDTVAEDGLPPLVEVADKFNAKSFNPQGGTIDIAALAALTPSLTESSSAINEANDQIQSVDATSLLSQLQGPVTEAQDKIGDAADIAERATTASRVVPQMLKGKHTYLLIFQNNAEIRATGGLPGAYAGLEVDNGTMKLVGQGAGGSFGELSYSATPISAEETELFSEKMVTDFRDANFTPDFPRAAEITAAIIAKETNVEVDGVISIDPVTLSYVLKAMGPVDLEDGTRLTSDNAVEVLLNGVYVNYPDPDVQDAFFASATDKIFNRVISGEGDPTALLKTLTRATNERRISLWSKNDAISQEIDGTAIANQLPFGRAKSPAIGFYLNDSTGAKMQYYLDSSISGKSTKCVNGVQSYSTEMTLRSRAPADSASLPESIQGPGFGAQPGSMLMNLYLYAPDGGKINSISFDGKKSPYFTKLTHEGRAVGVVTIQVNPGQTVKVGASMTSGKGQTGATTVNSTPSIVPGPSVQTWKSSC